MFKVPEWGADVPKSSIDINKLFPKGKKKPNKTKQNHISQIKNRSNEHQNKVQSKVKKFKNKNIRKVQAHMKNRMAKAAVAQTDSNQLHIQNYDTDKLDEVIINAKKKKLIDSYKEEDNEETLFLEDGKGDFDQRRKIQLKENNNETIVKKDTKNNYNVNKKRHMKVNPKAKSKEDSEKHEFTNNSNNENKVKNIKGNKKTKRKQKNINNDEIITPNNSGKYVKLENRKANITNVKQKNNGLLSKKDDKLHVTLSNTVNNKINKKVVHKKEVLQKILQSHRNTFNVISGNKLRERMLEKLNGAKFRFLNEKLYTSSGSEAQKMFNEDPSAFQTYHQGYQQQLKKWPVNPLDIVVKRIKQMPKTYVIADMGCGEAALSKRVCQAVRSFDLVGGAPGVEACDMAHTPLLAESVHVAVYCLALMGTDLTQYIVEANRVLKMGGHLLIAEVESRFDDVDSFAREVQRVGFTLKKLDKDHEVFYFMEFVKAREAPKKSKLPSLYLKPCVYKKR